LGRLGKYRQNSIALALCISKNCPSSFTAPRILVHVARKARRSLVDLRSRGDFEAFQKGFQDGRGR
jgi:hypothetical protein